MNYLWPSRYAIPVAEGDDPPPGGEDAASPRPPLNALGGISNTPYQRIGKHIRYPMLLTHLRFNVKQIRVVSNVGGETINEVIDVGTSVEIDDGEVTVDRDPYLTRSEWIRGEGSNTRLIFVLEVDVPDESFHFSCGLYIPSSIFHRRGEEGSYTYDDAGIQFVAGASKPDDEGTIERYTVADPNSSSAAVSGAGTLFGIELRKRDEYDYDTLAGSITVTVESTWD